MPPEGQIEPITPNFLRTLCGLRGTTPPLTCANALIHTLKRNESGHFRHWPIFADSGADLRKRCSVPISADGRFASW